MRSMGQVRVVLADDHRIVLEGLAALVDADRRYAVVATAGDGEAALAVVAEHRPDVVVADLSMPRLDGIGLCCELQRSRPDLPVILLTQHHDQARIQQAFAAGALGYVVKDQAFGELTRAIETVLEGKRYLSPLWAAELASRPLSSELLTKRETQVLRLIAEGLSNRQIGQQLNISIKTVDSHRTHLMRKLGIHRVADLVRYAVSSGLVELA